MSVGEQQISGERHISQSEPLPDQKSPRLEESVDKGEHLAHHALSLLQAGRARLHEAQTRVDPAGDGGDHVLAAVAEPLEHFGPVLAGGAAELVVGDVVGDGVGVAQAEVGGLEGGHLGALVARGELHCLQVEAAEGGAHLGFEATVESWVGV